MRTFEELSPEDQAQMQDAAAWWQRLQEEPALEISPEFQQWVMCGSNAQAFEATQRTMETLQAYAASPRILNMRRAALNRFRGNGIGWRGRYRAIALIAAVLLMMLAGAGGYLYRELDAGKIYSTTTGERRVVSLPDGSRISLDSDTKVRVQYAKDARRIMLSKGRARFDVAHDVSRPFTVTAGNQTVIAVGTSFNVERLGPEVLITLIQGRVSVKDDPPTSLLGIKSRHARTITLAAGEQVDVQENAAPVVTPANLDAATAWEAGHLVFRGEPLGNAVERVNRYTDNPIIVDDSVAAIPVSGVFNAGDVGSFVSAITGYFPVEATTESDNQIRLQKKS